eukprot:2131618-Amphidinium_carterae.1
MASPTLRDYSCTKSSNDVTFWDVLLDTGAVSVPPPTLAPHTHYLTPKCSLAFCTGESIDIYATRRLRLQHRSIQLDVNFVTKRKYKQTILGLRDLQEPN